MFGNLVNELLPSYLEEEIDASELSWANDFMPSGHHRSGSGIFSHGISSSPLFPEVDALLSMFKNSCLQLIDLRKQVRNLNYL